MKTRPKYTSILAPHINVFLDKLKAFGVITDRYEYFLGEFDRYAQAAGITSVNHLTRNFFAQWCESRVNDHEKTIYYKLTMLRQFVKHLNVTGNPCHVPTLPRTPYNNFNPYIFTHEEMSAIFKEFDKLPAYDHRMGTAAFSMPAIIRTLYATGMRVSECTSLKNKDVNLKEGTILIRVSKTKKERLVPISHSLSFVLKQYLCYRAKMHLRDSEYPESPFFIKTDGTAVISHRVLDRFHRVLKACGIPQTPKQHAPRVHDLRHTFAVHAMEAMLKRNEDLYVAMPILMTALGHTTLHSTNEYVRLTAAMFPYLKNQCKQLNDIIFNESENNSRE